MAAVDDRGQVRGGVRSTGVGVGIEVSGDLVAGGGVERVRVRRGRRPSLDRARCRGGRRSRCPAVHRWAPCDPRLAARAAGLAGRELPGSGRAVVAGSRRASGCSFEQVSSRVFGVDLIVMTQQSAQGPLSDEEFQTMLGMALEPMVAARRDHVLQSRPVELRGSPREPPHRLGTLKRHRRQVPDRAGHHAIGVLPARRPPARPGLAPPGALPGGGLLLGCKTDMQRVIAKGAGRRAGNLRRWPPRVLQTLQVCRWQCSEQRRQGAPHMAEVLQKLSVNRSNATLRHS